MAQQRFDTDQYDWSECKIQVDDRVFINIKSVSYSKKQEKSPHHGKGNEPLYIKRGAITYEGELVIYQDELERLIEKAPGKDLLRYRDRAVTVSYESEGGKLITDVLKGVEFTEVTKAMAQGTDGMEITLPFLFLTVQYQQ